MLKLQDYIDNNIGLQSLNRIYKPCKPYSCKDCHFAIYDTYTSEYNGCYNNFKVILSENKLGQKPESKCYPVMNDTYISEFHADNISCKIEKIKENEKILD